METGVSFELIGFDEHLLKVRVEAANGRFSGISDLYENLDWFAETCVLLKGFPRDAKDVREIEMGSSNMGYARLKFSCIDSAAHPVADIVLRAELELQTGTPDGKSDETVSLRLALEAAAIDGFCEELSRVKIARGQKVRLRSTDR